MQPQQTHLIPLKPFQLPNSLRKCVDVSKFAIDSKLENKPLFPIFPLLLQQSTFRRFAAKYHHFFYWKWYQLIFAVFNINYLYDTWL